MRILLDTNILVRAASSPPSPAEELLRICLSPPHVLCLSPFLLSEVSRVLRYPRVRKVHGMGEEKIDEYLRHLQSGGLMVTVPAEIDTVVPNDPKDDPIVATAVAAKVEAICTLDRHLHHESVVIYCSSRQIEIVTDLELLHRLRSESAAG